MFLRRRADGGMRVPNPFFDEADDFTRSLVLAFEEFEERAASHRIKLIRSD